jgi:hypothetical protein
MDAQELVGATHEQRDSLIREPRQALLNFATLLNEAR